MALKKRVMANIIGIEPIKFLGEKGDLVEKIKYAFITPDQEIIYGFLDSPREEWADKEIDTNVFVEQKAVETYWQGREWQGDTKWKLV